MLVALSAAAFGQAVYTVSSTPVTTVIATGNAELTGNITFTNTSGVTPLSGTISIQYGGTNVNITAPWSAILACVPNAIATTGSVAGCPTGYGTFTNLQVDLIGSIYSPGLLVIDVPATLPAVHTITIVGVRVQINGTGLTNLVANISANGNQITAGETNVTVINSVADGIAANGVVSYTQAPPLTTASVPATPTINTVTGVLSGTNWTISVKEGFSAAFTKGVGARITVSATPPKGVKFTFPMTATSYDVNGNVINPNWVLGSSTSTTAATGTQSISSSSTSASSLQVFYYVGTDTATNPPAFTPPDQTIEYLEIPVTLASDPTSETLPLPVVTFSCTVSLAPVQGPYNTSGPNAGNPVGLLAPRFTAKEVGPSTVLTSAGSQTNLLMPYVSVGGGFDTGIAIANTTEDPGTTALGITGAVMQSGPITFYFYPQNNSAAAFSYVTAATSPGSGLVTGTGNVQPGGTYVVLLSQLLTAAGQPAGFAGYIIVVTNFTDAYGIYTVSNFTTLAAYSTVMPFIVSR
jgi:hypothetical protein